MLHCDFYYPETTGGTENDHLYFLCADIPQCGDVNLDYTPDVEMNKSENGDYIVYSRSHTEKQIVLQFESTCSNIQKIAAYAKNGALAITGLYTGTDYEPNEMTGAFCYIDGIISTALISKEIDLMQISIPVIIRDTSTRVASLTLMRQGVYGFQFGNSDEAEDVNRKMIPLSDCRYIGNGQYVYDREIPFDYGTASAAVIGVPDPAGAFTAIPTFGIKSETDADYAVHAFAVTDNAQDATYFDIPVGGFDCYVKLKCAYDNAAKPFQIFFKCRRYGGNAAD